MKKETLQSCIVEAQRFLKKAKDLKAADEDLTKNDPETSRFKHFDVDLAKHTAAVRRSSLDLTHELAALRQDR